MRTPCQNDLDAVVYAMPPLMACSLEMIQTGTASINGYSAMSNAGRQAQRCALETIVVCAELKYTRWCNARIYTLCGSLGLIVQMLLPSMKALS